MFSEPLIVADDLKLLFTGEAEWQIQEHLNSIQQWVKTDEMDLATEKCAALKIPDLTADLMLGKSQQHSADSTKYLAIFATKDMTWSLHVSKRLKKANMFLYQLRRKSKCLSNWAINIHSSVLLPKLFYGMSCVRLSRGSTGDLENFRERAMDLVY